jgi:KDO2-lipid IV(A) lauroyltransferase
MNYRPRHLVEYGLLRSITAILGLLPYRLALILAWSVAGLLYVLGRARVREAERRIREVFGATLNETAVRRIAWCSLRNVCFNVVEIIRLPRLTRAWVDAHIDPGTLLALRASHLKPGQGSIFVIPHMGNWDLAGVGGSLFDIPVFVVAARQRNPLTDAYLNRMRAGQGMEVVMRDDHVVKRVLRALKKGQTLAFLTDLRSRTPGMRVQFLGKEANLVAGLGLFARQAGVPVFPGYVRREGWTRHVWHFEEPIWPDLSLSKEADWQRITQKTMDLFERAIRQYPEQYFWYNKRWVLDPLEADAAGEAVAP